MDLVELIKTVGIVGVWAIVFAESSFVFFLPGDSLLFTAGILAADKFFDVNIFALGCFVAAVAGNNFGYAFGKKFGKKLFKSRDSILFHKSHLEKAKNFYAKYGKKTIVLARFLPIVRTFAPIVAGMGEMHYPTFFTYNIIGGLLWAVGLTFAGYWLGNAIPDIDKYLLPIIIIIIVVSVAPTAFHILKDPNHRKEIFKAIKKFLPSFS